MHDNVSATEGLGPMQVLEIVKTTLPPCLINKLNFPLLYSTIYGKGECINSGLDYWNVEKWNGGLDFSWCLHPPSYNFPCAHTQYSTWLMVGCI